MICVLVEYSQVLKSCKINYQASERLIISFENSKDGIVSNSFPIVSNQRFIFFTLSEDRKAKDFRWNNFHFSKYYGNKILDNRTGSLCVLDADVYDGIYNNNSFCIQSNVMSCCTDWHTTKTSRYYVADVSSQSWQSDDRINIQVDIEKKKTFPYNKISSLLKKRSNKSSWNMEVPVIVTPAGKFLLIKKRDNSYSYPIEITKITILNKF